MLPLEKPQESSNMPFHITERNNFIRIFRIPNEFPSDFCFGGGHPVNFQLLDWFNPIPQEDLGSDKIKTLTEEEMQKHREAIREFIKVKNYYDPEFKFLALSDYSDVFLI